MTPQEIAMKFASASATCKNGKCPYTAQCRGTNDTCKMKEVAVVIRSTLEELATYKARCQFLENELANAQAYAADLELINERYYRLAVSFQRGVKPKAKIHRKKTMKRVNKPKKSLVEMDGDERYAAPKPPPPPDLPVVII